MTDHRRPPRSKSEQPDTRMLERADAGPAYTFVTENGVTRIVEVAPIPVRK